MNYCKVCKFKHDPRYVGCKCPPGDVEIERLRKRIQELEAGIVAVLEVPCLELGCKHANVLACLVEIVRKVDQGLRVLVSKEVSDDQS